MSSEFSVISRLEAVELARAWKGTPYVLRGRVRGAGADCGTLLAEYLIGIGAAGQGAFEDLGVYHHDWFCHETNERYMLRLMRYALGTIETICRPSSSAEPGSIILFRSVGSKLFNHGCIATNWPFGIHAVHPCVKESNMPAHRLAAYREMKIFDPWQKPDPRLVAMLEVCS